MGKLVRFGVSLEASLLKKFDPFIATQGYASRSEAIRDLIRERLVAEEWKTGTTPAMGVLSLVYSHEVRELAKKLTDIQHRHLGIILSTTHIHMDEHNCLEVVILKGSARKIQEVAGFLLSAKGVKHGKLITTTTGSHLE
ncbi:MAG: nickel-responsive transcriptional regulator NikR [Acidobacteria bacterium]|jgi:CopG family nickel-responsive transcriptional regulator|nr:nickel-responsive transcriptional regulator NikR [Acidobacteriota bacterium]